MLMLSLQAKERERWRHLSETAERRSGRWQKNADDEEKKNAVDPEATQKEKLPKALVTRSLHTFASNTVMSRDVLTTG